MNELALVERPFEAKGWSLAHLVEHGDVNPTGPALFGPTRPTELPDRASSARLADALDVPYREVGVAAVGACGLATTPFAGRDVTLRGATGDQLLRELRRRLLILGHRSTRRRQLVHLTFVGRALAGEGR